MGDIYAFANDNKFGMTFCVPLLSLEGEFYAALCYDLKIIQKPIPFLRDENLTFKLQSTPLVLQQS